ncbi:MAG: hypothetical protein M0Q21_11570 [Ignavibacteriaceae bacterium]|nr:hypothetical protein [Ignavibacteriaceae bacterium]
MGKIIFNIHEEDDFLLGFGISVGVHLLLLFLAIALRSGIFISSNSVQKSMATKMRFLFENNFSNSSNINPGIIEGNKLLQKSETSAATPVSVTGGLSSPFANADTTFLSQYYSETSLNVRLKFPVGWTYIDQNVKKKLDGVTFYGDPQIFNPPPYVHLEVVEKYLFNPSRYSEKAQNSNYEYYFNAPEELEGIFSQIIYIKTDIDEDFIIKLIVKGKEPFYRFLPSFWGIVQSFDFGSSIF